MLKRWRGLMRLGLAAGMVAVSGCSGMHSYLGNDPSPQQVASADTPPPRVQNCGIVGIGSPTKYACNGKVYTSFDLLRLRLAWEKNHGG
jgi:hypothetical protein